MASVEVEFVGGPLDGHVQPMTDSPESLPVITGVPVSRNLLRSLHGPQDRDEGAVTSVAVYQLHQDEDDLLRYYHLCSIAEDECELKDVP